MSSFYASNCGRMSRGGKRVPTHGSNPTELDPKFQVRVNSLSGSGRNSVDPLNPLLNKVGLGCDLLTRIDLNTSLYILHNQMVFSTLSKMVRTSNFVLRDISLNVGKGTFNFFNS